MNQQVKLHGALFMTALIAGANYSIAKEVMPAYVEPFGLIAVRVVSAALFFGILVRWRKLERITGWADNIRVVVSAALGIALNQLMFFWGLSLTSPINASLIQIISPIVVVVLSLVVLQEKLSARRLGGTALAAVGTFLLIWQSGTARGPGNSFGDILVLLNSAAYGAYLVVVQPLMKRYNALVVMSRMFLYGTVMVLPFGLPQLLTPDWASFPLSIWAAILFMVLALTIFLYHINVWAMNFASPSLIGAYIYLQPVMAILIAVAFGKDTMTMERTLYALLIFAGVYLASRKPLEKPEVA